MKTMMIALTGALALASATLLRAEACSERVLPAEKSQKVEKCPHCEAPKSECRKDHCPLCGTVRVERRCGRCDDPKKRDNLMVSAIPGDVPPPPPPTCDGCGAKASNNGSITHKSNCPYAPKKQ